MKLGHIKQSEKIEEKKKETTVYATSDTKLNQTQGPKVVMEVRLCTPKDFHHQSAAISAQGLNQFFSWPYRIQKLLK